MCRERRRVAADTINVMQRAVALIERGDFDACRNELTALFDTSASLAAVRRQFASSRVHLRWRQFEKVVDEYRDGPSLASLTAGRRRLTNSDLRCISADHLGRNELELPVNNHYSARTWALAVQPESGSMSAERDATDYRLKSTGIRTIDVRNFLGITDMKFSLADSYTPGSWTMLLGENGTGKTSVLKAIAVALSTDDELRKANIRPASVFRNDTSGGFVTVELAAGEGVLGRSFARGSAAFEHEGITPRARVAAYGATRLLPSHSVEVLRASFVALGTCSIHG